MNRILMSAAAVVLSATAALAADPLEGTWRTAPDDNGHTGLINVAPCGAALCGTLMKAFDGTGAEVASENIGRQIISETMAKGDGAYKGKVYAPDRDKTYNSKLQLSGNTLAVSGCVLGICRNGGTWTKVE
ncbi:DUF2147 domain-containing protein [Roseovarius sp. LXJ103]|uniref:DUF2147 domain-containing protein n=1 Tax=Roseovarius carneus TaxID=2853164 RepID=UPI000D60B847|nr:DUF2147 domain-containing protein [Roseovarius carneus]MBZ8118955.1 DUF2147 domain-containing protein [Roseovarius carneus]PWE35389.1 DUF2147 domain-containing protein [Pelagicola sp. LXJ1103]